MPCRSHRRSAQLDDLLAAFKADPESISWGGGSAGGSDQILAGLIAAAVGVEARRVNYIGFSGGGEAFAAILGGQVSVGINGLAEFAAQIDAGTLRVLAVSSAERLPGVDAPTLRERGVDVEFENWRSIVAPPGITAVERARLAAAVEAMVRSSEWRELLARFRWLDRYLAGDEFAAFAAAEERRVRASLARARHRAARRAAAPTPSTPTPRSFSRASRFSASRPPSLSGAAQALASAIDALAWRPLGLIGAGAALHVLARRKLGLHRRRRGSFLAHRASVRRAPPGRATPCARSASQPRATRCSHYALQLPLPAGVLGGWL